MIASGHKPFRRLLVAMDAAPENQAVLDAIADLADALAQEIAGMFIEDEDLLTLAGLPFARETPTAGGASRTIDVGALERSMRRALESARNKLEATARRQRLAWSLEVVRGSVSELVVAASSPTDLILLGPSLGARSRHAHESCRARLETAAHFGGALLKAPGPGWRPGPVWVVVDEERDRDRALAVARAIRGMVHGGLHLLHWAGPAPIPAPGETLVPVAGPADLLHRLETLRQGIIVMPVASALRLCPVFEAFVGRSPCPVLVVGEPTSAEPGATAAGEMG